VRKGKRRTIAANCYEDKTGRSIIYRNASGRQREIRFPPDTPISDMRKEVLTRLARDTASGDARTRRGTLADAIDRWEPLEQSLASWKERRAELRAWKHAIGGDVRLTAITAVDARRVMSAWAMAGVSPKTIRNRRWALQHLYRVLLGQKAETPVDDIPPPPKTKTIPRAIDPAVVLEVYENLLQLEAAGILQDTKTRARFMVRASTGKRPSEIMRAQPSDVDLIRREWRVRDGKGGWGEGLYLNDDMHAAWTVFAEAGAWGYFDTSAQARLLHSCGWPADVRPYELRHSTGIALTDAGIDLADISAFLGHSDLRTTRRTYVPIRQARMQRASEALEGRFGWSVPATVPATRLGKAGKARRNVESAAIAPESGKQAKATGRTQRK
jgi:integrase